jgi:predicted RNA-binding Zn-ribbon protein involved in translation (DUF1610 family)
MDNRYLRCKKCGEWFEAPPLPEYKASGLSSMEKCGKCGKWAIYGVNESRAATAVGQTTASG